MAGSELRLLRVSLTGIAVFILSFGLVFSVIAGYALILGFQARGAPDQQAISAFAARVGPVLGPIAGLLLTLAGAAWTARKAPNNKLLHGTLVGGVVAAISLVVDARSGLDSSALMALALTLGAGALGGWIGARRAR